MALISPATHVHPSHAQPDQLNRNVLGISPSSFDSRQNIQRFELTAGTFLQTYSPTSSRKCCCVSDVVDSGHIILRNNVTVLASKSCTQVCGRSDQQPSASTLRLLAVLQTLCLISNLWPPSQPRLSSHDQGIKKKDLCLVIIIQVWRVSILLCHTLCLPTA